MIKKIFFIFSILIFFTTNHVFAENYNFQIDEHNFNISYTMNSGSVLAMAIDQELASFLIATQNVDKDTVFSIKLPSEMIKAENNAFAVLVNGIEIDYDLKSTQSESELTFVIPVFTEEIEIIGTKVIPEFPLGPLIIFTILSSLVIMLSKNKIFSR